MGNPADMTRAHPFYDAYLAGLCAFEEAIDDLDRDNEEHFKEILNVAIEHLSVVTASALADRVGHSKGTISKWLHSETMPARGTREIAIEWIKTKTQAKIAELNAIQFDKVATG